VLRGLAVCGILIGNMQWNSGYGLMPPAIEQLTPVYDRVTHYLVHVIIEGKFYSIFSFLFGFGFALQIARANERGDTKETVFKRRLFWLLIIGLIHAFVWAGDILSVYALMGFVLLLFRRKSDESVLKWVLILIAIPIVTYLLMYVLFVNFAPPDTAAQIDAAQAEMWRNELELMPKSGFWEITTGYNLNMLAGRWIALIVQMRLPKILAMFLLGCYAYRKGFLQNVSRHRSFIRQVMIYGSSAGIVLNLLFAWFAHSEADFPPSLNAFIGVVTYAVGVPSLALGVIALIVTLWQNDAWKKVLGIFAPVGRMALTNYLTQTVISMFIFYGWGLGLYGKVGPLYATLIAFAIFAVQIVTSTIWLKYFAYGPVEWIWRQLTYRKRLSLRLKPQAEPISS